jgi:hypothetical protein
MRNMTGRLFRVLRFGFRFHRPRNSLCWRHFLEIWPQGSASGEGSGTAENAKVMGPLAMYTAPVRSDARARGSLNIKTVQLGKSRFEEPHTLHSSDRARRRSEPNRLGPRLFSSGWRRKNSSPIESYT